MTDVEALAKILKGHRNPHKIGTVIGTVVEAPPDEEEIVIAVNYMDTTFTVKEFYSLCGSSFEKGDRVALQFSEDNSTVYVLGKPIFVGGDDK